MTEVNIQKMESNVRVVDGESLLSPQELEKVLEAVEEREQHRSRVNREQRIESGEWENSEEGWI